MARDLRLFYLFRLLATSYLWVPISVAFMQSRGLSWDEIMYLVALYSGVIIAVEVPTGAFADRIGRRQSMMFGALAMVAACLIAYGAHGFAVFALSQVLAAVSLALCSGADSAYLFDLLRENGHVHEYPRRETLSSAWHYAGNTLAFVAAGILVHIDLALPYLVSAGVAMAAFFVALCMRTERRPRASKRRTTQRSMSDELGAYMRHMRQSLSEVRRSKKLAWVIAYSAIGFVLLRSTDWLYQPYLDSRGFSLSEICYIFAGLNALATFVAQSGDALRRRIGTETMAYGLLGVLAATFILLGRFHGAWVALAMMAVQASANGLYSPLVKTLLNHQIVDSDRRATILSVESIARRGAFAAFAPAAGMMGAASAMYLCGGIGFAGLALLAMFALHAPFGARLPAAVSRSSARDRL